jgi:hypothetical protein
LAKHFIWAAVFIAGARLKGTIIEDVDLNSATHSGLDVRTVDMQGRQRKHLGEKSLCQSFEWKQLEG